MIKKSYNKNLHKLNTFGMKVRASLYIEYDSAEDLTAIQWDKLPQPVLNMGEGSNLLFTKDFPGTVLHSGIKGMDVVEQMSSGDDLFVRVGAGVIMDDFCDWAARKEVWGPENLSAIPGTVGAAPVQNIGAYGVEAADIIDSVECFEIATGKIVSFSAEECDFAYRDSFFKHNRGRFIVTHVTFHLHGDFRPVLEYGKLKEEVERNAEIYKADADPYKPIYQTRFVPPMPICPMLVRETVKIIRENKLPSPSKKGSAGSFFKNPVVDATVFHAVEDTAAALKGETVTVPHYDLPDGSVKIPAAWLIEFCGFKGRTCGGAAVWEKQPLVIVNDTGRATPRDILALERTIIEKIKDTFGIELSPEVDHI